MNGNRGGEQKIPRPQNWEMGSSPPWQKANQNKLTLHSIEKSLEQFRPNEITRENYERSSSVMIPLYEEDDQVHMILTRRSKMMRHHTSEISFPVEIVSLKTQMNGQRPKEKHMKKSI